MHIHCCCQFFFFSSEQGWTLEYPWAQPSPQDFVCAAVINGRVVAEERGVTRRMARENASQRANQTLCPEPTRQPFAREVRAWNRSGFLRTACNRLLDVGWCCFTPYSSVLRNCEPSPCR